MSREQQDRDWSRWRGQVSLKPHLRRVHGKWVVVMLPWFNPTEHRRLIAAINWANARNHETDK